eukprot:NODE_367_length_8687_cov_0.577084.p6 type:complete len:125 gc:universal NODE_367_length_8687_cov_0.577084:5271-5645(+)
MSSYIVILKDLTEMSYPEKFKALSESWKNQKEFQIVEKKASIFQMTITLFLKVCQTITEDIYKGKTSVNTRAENLIANGCVKGDNPISIQEIATSCECTQAQVQSVLQWLYKSDGTQSELKLFK